MSDSGYICKEFEHEYPATDGIIRLMSDSVIQECFFPNEKFNILFQSEELNFWFRVRNKIIKNAIDRYAPSSSRILEVGCGTGYVSRYLKSNGYHVECTDLSIDALKFCKEREAGYQYYQFNLMDRIFIEEFDGICAFDVIEHINDDATVLKNLHEALKPGGTLIITVPADMRLWSEKDIHAEHKRRYSIKELQKKVEDNGFKIMKLSYFMTFLYPVILFSRKVSYKGGKIVAEKSTKKIQKKSMNELQPNRILNSILFSIFNIEVPLLNLFDFPFGSSLLCIAYKET